MLRAVLMVTNGLILLQGGKEKQQHAADMLQEPNAVSTHSTRADRNCRNDSAHQNGILHHKPTCTTSETRCAMTTLLPALCLQDFYQQVVLRKLNPGGIFITQSGPAGFLSCTEVFTCINATLRSVFPKVLPYTQHMPVFCDVWGWNMALTDPSQADMSPEDMDARIAERIEGEIRFLDGHTFRGLCQLNKHVRK